jgi:DNA polymerase-3 subunit delta'
VTPLFGHDAAVAAFRDALDGGKLPHAWLIAGAPGIGKALFAEKAALRVLAQAAGPSFEAAGLDTSSDHPIAALVEAGSHPDLMRLERLPADNAAGIARSITVDQVRGLHRLFDTTASLSPWRVVIIDSADELEGRGAPNALLKMLEEPPPNSLFLLVSHYPDRLLPTIRSRCRLLRLKPLADDAMASALRGLAPEASEAEIAAMVRSASGAPGRALAQRGLELDRLDATLDELVRGGDPTNARRSALASALALKAAQPRYEAFLARAPARIAAEARGRRGAELAQAIALWERAVALAGAAQRLSLDVPSTVFELAGMLAALAPERTSARAA